MLLAAANPCSVEMSMKKVLYILNARSCSNQSAQLLRLARFLKKIGYTRCYDNYMGESSNYQNPELSQLRS